MNKSRLVHDLWQVFAIIQSMEPGDLQAILAQKNLGLVFDFARTLSCHGPTVSKAQAEGATRTGVYHMIYFTVDYFVTVNQLVQQHLSNPEFAVQFLMRLAGDRMQ